MQAHEGPQQPTTSFSAVTIPPMASSSSESSPLSSPTTPTASFQYPLHNPRTQDFFHSIVKGRKSWKTLRGGEVVWPPELEAALIEGARVIQPLSTILTYMTQALRTANRMILGKPDYLAAFQ